MNLTIDICIDSSPGSGSHWVQSFVFLKRPLIVTEGDIVLVRVRHDDHAFYFDVFKPSELHASFENSSIFDNKSAESESGIPVSVYQDRRRLAMLHDTARTTIFYSILCNTRVTGKTVVCIDGAAGFLINAAIVNAARFVFGIEWDAATALALLETLAPVARENDVQLSVRVA